MNPNILDELVVKYKQTKDDQVFNELWKIVQPRLLRVSQSLRYASVEDKEDCFQECSRALLRAIEAWDPVEAAARGTHFENYLSLACLNEKIGKFTSSKWSTQMLGKNQINRNALRIDKQVSEDSDTTFEDLILDRREIGPENLCMIRDFVDMFLGWASVGLERAVIELLICQHYNLTEISKKLGCNTSRVSLIVRNYREKAMSRMTDRMLKEFCRVFEGKKIVMSY